jgi:hypothetical protein
MQQEDCIEIKHKRYRCNEPDCSSGTRDKTDKYIAHGGGKRCDEPDCSASATHLSVLLTALALQSGSLHR